MKTPNMWDKVRIYGWGMVHNEPLGQEIPVLFDGEKCVVHGLYSNIVVVETEYGVVKVHPIQCVKVKK